LKEDDEFYTNKIAEHSKKVEGYVMELNASLNQIGRLEQERHT
jgi:hypothetical protein